jgi:hypothetical protein
MNAQPKLLQIETRQRFLSTRSGPIHPPSTVSLLCAAHFIFFPLASDRLPDSEPQADPIPHWSFRSHFIFPISPLSAPAVMITMSGFADSSLTCLGQRPRRGRSSKSAHMQLAQVRLSYMDRMTLSTLHHLDEPLSSAMASSLECLTLLPVILMERRGHSRSLSRSKVFQLR